MVLLFRPGQPRDWNLELVTAFIDRSHDCKCSVCPLNRLQTFEDVALGRGPFIWGEVEQIKLRKLFCDWSLPRFHIHNRMSRCIGLARAFLFILATVWFLVSHCFSI